MTHPFDMRAYPNFEHLAPEKRNIFFPELLLDLAQLFTDSRAAGVSRPSPGRPPSSRDFRRMGQETFPVGQKTQLDGGIPPGLGLDTPAVRHQAVTCPVRLLQVLDPKK